MKRQGTDREKMFAKQYLRKDSYPEYIKKPYNAIKIKMSKRF